MAGGREGGERGRKGISEKRKGGRNKQTAVKEGRTMTG